MFLFWIGIVIAALGGLLNINYIQTFVLSLLHFSSPWFIEIVAVLLLTAGLAISVVQYYSDRKAADLLRKDSQAIKRLTGEVSLVLRGDWLGDTPPNEIVKLHFSSSPSVILPLTMKNGEHIDGKFVGRGTPILTPVDSQRARFHFEVELFVDSPLIGRDRNDFQPPQDGTVYISGIYSTLVKDSRITFDSFEIALKADGKPLWAKKCDIGTVAILQPGANYCKVLWDGDHCQIVPWDLAF